MKVLLIILGVIGLVIIGGMYLLYKVMVFQAVVLRSAGKMKTGNDLGEQMEDTLKNEKRGVPNVFQFYWNLFKRIREGNE